MGQSVMHRMRLAIFLCVFAQTLYLHSAHAFSFLGFQDFTNPVLWSDADLDGGLTFAIAPNFLTGTSGASAAVGNAFDTWSAGNSTLNFMGPATVEFGPSLGANIDFFSVQSDFKFGQIEIKGKLALSFPDTVNGRILGVDIFINQDFAFSTNPGAGEFDIESVALHEIGHAIGFDHTDVADDIGKNFDSSGTSITATGLEVMNSTIALGEISRVLTTDEIAALDTFYSEDQTFTLTVNNGTGDGTFTAGTVVNISADAPPAGKVFDKWTGDVSNVANVNAASTSITMPGANTTITATYKDHTITLVTPDGDVTIIVPSGALADETTISITDSGSNFELTTNEGTAPVVISVDILPEGTVFDPPLRLVFGWNDADNDGTVDGTTIREVDLRITKDNVVITGRCRDETGPELPICDTNVNTFTFEVSSFSSFALIGPIFLEHFTGYDVRPEVVPSGTGKDGAELNSVVTLTDQFGTSLKTVKTAKRLLVPVDKNGEGIGDQMSHLTCYTFKKPKGEPKEPKFEPVEVVVSNQFDDEQFLTVKKPKRLCVPTTRELVENIANLADPANLPVGHFQCYDVKIPKGLPKFVEQDVFLSDQFDDEQFLTVKKPKTLCVPSVIIE